MSKKELALGRDHLLGLWLEWAILDKSAAKRDELVTRTTTHLYPYRSEQLSKKGGFKAYRQLLHDSAG